MSTISNLQGQINDVNTRIDEIIIPDYEKYINEIKCILDNIPDYNAIITETIQEINTRIDKLPDYQEDIEDIQEK